MSTEGPFELHVGGVKLELTIGALITDIAIIANKFEFTGGASEELLLGGKVDCHWPEKWTVRTIVYIAFVPTENITKDRIGKP